LKAIAVDDKQRLDIVRYASSHSDAMFKGFRDEGAYGISMSPQQLTIMMRYV
jgi:hypothetical protein